ncbi:SH3 domain-containing kinase-binding protein 1-like isoform X2 [Panonychus citri]|uniref:SH3 domain-containing kinase-binding protein 1-like isoform X2 n=1 Tax=Panonychus citri TaxID=50023 RepID=UPI0023081E95|nr:SH3 domain-containing kinase-binding protein 1-like isoform X2 [Panonychus citri]
MDPFYYKQSTNLKGSLRPVDKSKPPPKKPPPQAPSTQDAGGDISAPRLPPKPKREQARAIYDYKAQNDDELTIRKGDIIIILSKGVEDEGWWKGELNGKIGVFPDNYIEVIKTAPMDEVILPLRTKKPERLNEKPPPPSCIGSPGGGIGSTNPTGSQTKLNISEVVRNNNNLKSTQQTPSTTTITTAITNSTTNTNSTCGSTNNSNSSTLTSAINPLTSSLTNSMEEENLSFISPVVPSKKPKFRAPPGSISILPVTSLIKSSVLGGSKPDVVTSNDTATNKLDSSGNCSKESKSMPDERISSIINENEIILGSLDSTRRLNHPTANRVKGPNRRPPSMIVLTKEDDNDNDLDLFDEPKSESKIHSSATLSSLSSTPASNPTTTSPTTTATTTGSTNDLTEKEKVPAIPPWMKELKRSQAERRIKNSDNTTSVLGGEETLGGANQVTPLSPTKSNPSRSISLPVEITETNSSPVSTTTTITTPSSPSTINSLLSGKPLKAAKPSATSIVTTTISAVTATTTTIPTTISSAIVSSSSSGSILSSTPPKSLSISNISNKSGDFSLSPLNKGVSDFSDIQVELNNLKKSMVPRRDYEDLVKKVNELTDMVETVKESYGSVVRDLINQVAEARKNMATLEIEVDRLRKLSTTV